MTQTAVELFTYDPEAASRRARQALPSERSTSGTEAASEVWGIAYGARRGWEVRQEMVDQLRTSSRRAGSRREWAMTTSTE